MDDFHHNQRDIINKMPVASKHADLFQNMVDQLGCRQVMVFLYEGIQAEFAKKNTIFIFGFGNAIGVEN